MNWFIKYLRFWELIMVDGAQGVNAGYESDLMIIFVEECLSRG